MKHVFEAITLSFVLATGSSALAQTAAQQPHGNGTQSLTVEKFKPSDSMIEMRAAVRDLRQASVKLLNEKQPGNARDQAFRAAQDAIKKVQTAMEKMKPDTTGTIKHDAKSWPVVAGRFDQAAAALDDAVENLSKASGGDQSGALDSAQAALKEVQAALHDLPDAGAAGAHQTR